MATKYRLSRNTVIYLAISTVVLFGILFRDISSQWPDTANADLLSEASLSGSAPSFPMRASSPEGAVDVPILVYHSIRPPYVRESEAIRKVTVSPDIFAKEMNYLQTSGYRVIPFAGLEKYLGNGTPLPPKPIIISFDDCWEDQFTYAFPVLRKYHYTATFFVITNYVGHRDFLSWSQVRQLLSAGMTIGSHSRSHPFLDRITDHNRLLAEIYESKRTIEQKLGTPVNEFAYPYGAFSQEVVSLVRQAGYRSARADYPGGWHSRNDQYFFSAINASTDFDVFQKTLPLYSD